MLHSYITPCSPLILKKKNNILKKNKSKKQFICYRKLTPILHLDRNKIEIDYNNKNTIFYYLYYKE
jgi:hypothetical protein